MYSFTVNGVPRETDQDKTLLRYLRDDLGLKSVKDGCSEGACGTCTVIVDGKAVKACVQKTSRLEGRQIVTCEGSLSGNRTPLSMPSARWERSSAGSAPPAW